MAVENLTYTGINRAVTDYSGSRACEELINLRPTPDGIAPVKPFSTKFADKPWHRLLVHYTTSGQKYIAVYKDGTSVSVSLVDGTTGAYVGSPLFSVTGLSTDAAMDDVLENVSFAAAGNIVLFSVCAAVAGKYENHAFVWKLPDGAAAETYVRMEAEIPSVTYSVSSTVGTAATNIASLDGTSSREDVVAALESALNAAQENNADLCTGPVLIAIAFKTTDGNTFWSGNWKIHDPIPSINADDRFYLDGNSQWFNNQIYVDTGFYTKHGHGYSMVPLTSSGTQGGYEAGKLDTITVPGTKVTLTFPAVSGWNEETSIVQSVEVYCSKPQLYLDTASAADGYIFIGATMRASLVVPQRDYADMDLGGQLLYHQASIPMASLASADQTVNLSFGGNLQVVEDTLDVDAGAVRRYGRLLSYNARFHYFDSVSKIDVGMPYLYRTFTSSKTCHVFVRYADSDQTQLLYVGDDTIDPESDHPAEFVIASSINAREVTTATWRSDIAKWVLVHYRMDASTAYNYTFNGGGATGETMSQADWEASEYYASLQAGTGPVTNVEPAAINVTEQYNPFVFRVEHSYLAPGNVLDVQPQMTGVADTSYGRDPLSVFTERGTYALTQGSADVLYGAFLPVSDVVVNSGRGGTMPTPYGTFFLGAGSLWLIVGRRAQLISDALERGPHRYIRTCPGYALISGSGGQYDVSAEVSAVPFWDFVTGARLSYNRFRSELMVSNPTYSYTYVLSLIHRQWFKMAGCFTQSEAGSAIVSIPSNLGRISILDMENETSGTHEKVHLQTRPFSMAYQYSHVHRTVAMARACLSGTAGDLLVSALYGSDDLQDWTLLAYAKRAGSTATSDNVTTDVPLKVSQVRTPSAARSWRYYTLCIGGKVDTESEFGPVLVDYEPVIRRIG